MDAVDAALVDLQGPMPVLACAYNHALPVALKRDLLALCEPSADEIQRFGAADNQVAELFAEAALALLRKAGVETDRIAAIGSHGQTIRHHPKGRWPFTLQIGNPALIAERTAITTVADFRRADMAAGGQGAPLVPAFHNMVFRTADTTRVVLNIGGMANITLLPRDPAAAVIGYDTGPGNVLLDMWIAQHQGRVHDQDGAWGARGQVHPALLEALLDDPYFAAAPPKSTGREHFRLAWLETALARVRGPVEPQAVQATLAEMVARTISAAILRHADDAAEVLVCGGGVHNTDLLNRLRGHLPGKQVISTAHYGLHPDYIEAATFAWLARRALEGRPGNIPSVTGARHEAILGAVYKAWR